MSVYAIRKLNVDSFENNKYSYYAWSQDAEDVIHDTSYYWTSYKEFVELMNNTDYNTEEHPFVFNSDNEARCFIDLKNKESLSKFNTPVFDLFNFEVVTIDSSDEQKCVVTTFGNDYLVRINKTVQSLKDTYYSDERFIKNGVYGDYSFIIGQSLQALVDLANIGSDNMFKNHDGNTFVNNRDMQTIDSTLAALNRISEDVNRAISNVELIKKHELRKPIKETNLF